MFEKFRQLHIDLASVCRHTTCPFLCSQACGLSVWWRWCALWWCVVPFSPIRGGWCFSDHHFFRHGLPIRYSLIPVMFRSSMLAASFSSCVL